MLSKYDMKKMKEYHSKYPAVVQSYVNYLKRLHAKYSYTEKAYPQAKLQLNELYRLYKFGTPEFTRLRSKLFNVDTCGDPIVEEYNRLIKESEQAFDEECYKSNVPVKVSKDIQELISEIKDETGDFWVFG